jgi:hypothetical protein
MREHDAVASVIDRIVSAARIPSRAEREDIRRELWTHFDEAHEAPDGVIGAIERFGPEAMIVESLRQVYRWDYLVLYLVKIAISVIACIAAALLIQVLVNLRVELAAEVWRLAPGFSHAAVLSVGVVLGLVVAWEVSRRPFNGTRAIIAVCAYAALCLIFQITAAATMGPFITATMLTGVGSVCSKLERWPARLLVALGAFGATLYLRHHNLNIGFGPARAALVGGVYVAVWASTLVILGRLDDAFRRSVFGPTWRQGN